MRSQLYLRPWGSIVIITPVRLIFDQRYPFKVSVAKVHQSLELPEMFLHFIHHDYYFIYWPGMLYPTFFTLLPSNKTRRVTGTCGESVCKENSYKTSRHGRFMSVRRCREAERLARWDDTDENMSNP